MELKKYKLADIAKIEISGVDKKTIEGETPVRLCNFVDVYYNWAITKEKAKSFMVASAKQTEIDKCSIGKGMVAITKDSETRDDIGVATYIADDFEYVLLGYHCALITPNPAIVDGKYLNAFMHTRYIQKYFENNASGSGQRYTLSNDTIGNIPVLIPSIEEQRTIGKVLADIDRKIELNKLINDNLEAQTQALFDELFLRDGMPDCTLSEIANVNPTRTLSKGCIAKCYDMSCLPTRGCVPEGGEMKAYTGGVRFQNGDTLIARITPCLENGKAAYINILNDKEVAFGSTEYIVFSPVDTMPSSFYYFLIRSKKFRTFALQYMNGSSGRQRVSGDELAAFPLTKPSQEALSRFDMVAKPVLEQFKVASLEINRLNALQQLIIASISSR